MGGLQAVLQALQTQGFKQFDCIVPVEVGAMNSAVPLIVGLQRGLKVIDADGAGRSIPTLPLDTFAGDGIPLCPCVLASDAPPGQPCSFFVLDLPGPSQEDTAEKMLGEIIMSQSLPYQGVAGLACYPMTGQTLQSKPPVTGDLWLALQLGSYFLKGMLDPLKLKDAIHKTINPIRTYKFVFDGYITHMTPPQPQQAQDYGEVVVTTHSDGTGDKLTIHYENENILAYLSTCGNEKPYVMGPDSICYVPWSWYGGQPVFDNSDLWNIIRQLGQHPQVSILAIDAPAVVKGNSALIQAWQALYSTFGYIGPYEQPWLRKEGDEK